MPGQPFLLTIAGLALSVAGFAGLMAAFRRDASWTPTDLWRLRGIVRLSFLCMFLALAPVPLFALVQDERLAVAISSLLVASVYAWEALGVLRERAASGPAAWMTAYLLMDAVLGAVQLANVVLVLPGLLMLGLLVRLAHPVGLFVEAIRSFQPSPTP